MEDFIPQEIIRAKRDKGKLSDEEIAFFVRGLTDDSLSEGQVAAFAMAVYFQGLDRAESVALTRAMTESGRVLDWSALERPLLDKHSTGGVGDKVSLILAPVMAACGAAVPMISGRGLGHTGGTLDKLEAIPGYRTAPDLARFQAVVRNVGCAIVGQTADLAPADRRLYAIRDVTATVESVPLITASILSKKLAAGLQGLVMDVKTGNGAFMTDLDSARRLAESIVAVAKGAGLACSALITDMNQVLGRTAGNALEVIEAVDHLTGRARDPRLHEVVTALCSELLQLGGLAESAEDAGKAVAEALDSGRAAEIFARMVAALEGPTDFLAKADRELPRAPITRAILPDRGGFVVGQDTRAIGMAIVALGGGRRRADQGIDHAVGFAEMAGLGEAVGPDRPLAVVHAGDADAAAKAAQRLRAAYRLAAEAPERKAAVQARVP
ncbi:MAG TPA: thymidine phosphorylase [Kiloniellaceae bacterium]|nr:thymidine phosphorylase [Kiloniellaceae bacterium]